MKKKLFAMAAFLCMTVAGMAQMPQGAGQRPGGAGQRPQAPQISEEQKAEMIQTRVNEVSEDAGGLDAATQGKVKDLSLIYMMPNLKHLALVNQPVSNITGLKDLVLLLDLNLAATEVSDLSGLTNLPSLQTLNLEHTKVKDLTPLSREKEGTAEKELPLLTKVTVSKDMLPLILDKDAQYDVVLVK